MSDLVESWLRSFSSQDPAAVTAYLLLHVGFAVLFLPCSPLTVLAGLIWGLWPGLPISMAGALLSSAATFGLSRWFRRHRSARWLAESLWFGRIRGPVQAITGAGWRSVVLFQATPWVPGSSIGYVFGFTTIRPGEFMMASLAGMVPMQAIVVAGSALAYDAIALNEMRGYASRTMLALALGSGALIWLRWRRSRAKAGEAQDEGRESRVDKSQ